MRHVKTLFLISKGFILLSACSLLAVSLMAFNNPQAVMDMVSVKLTTNDALSSIRGVYGGVGLTLFITLVFSLRKQVAESLRLLVWLWGLYAVSRVYTMIMEGALDSFGKQWLLIEALFFVVALVLFLVNKRFPVVAAHRNKWLTKEVPEDN